MNNFHISMKLSLQVYETHPDIHGEVSYYSSLPLNNGLSNYILKMEEPLILVSVMKVSNTEPEVERIIQGEGMSGENQPVNYFLPMYLENPLCLHTRRVTVS